MGANPNQPFIFNASVGTFLYSVAVFFVCAAIGIALCCPVNLESNQLLIIVLFHALIIHFLLAANSRLLYSIFAFLTIGSLMVQLFFIFGWVFAKSFQQLTTGQTIIFLSIILFLLSFLIGTQVFCSAAFLKLSGVGDHPKPIHKPRRRRRESPSVSQLPSSMTPCTHTPSCSIISVEEPSTEKSTQSA
uniref:Uncharacterized protein n=1 Tax=Caenorhabditis tropicalis TaxID=1561998 RepID=A0A1I7T722_9PELO